MKIFTLLLFSTLLFSKVYYSKTEPYEMRTIASNVAGLVILSDESALGTKLGAKPFIEIDSEIDRADLVSTTQKIGYLEETLRLNKTMLKNLESSLSKKRQNFKRISALKVKAQIEKDKEFHDLIASENSYVSTQKEIMNLKTQLSDLKLKERQLKRSIRDKKLIAKGFTLYALDVKVGQVVAPATPLAKVADTSKALLSIYLDEEDMPDARKKSIYIDGVKTKYKISRLIKIADSKNISKYMAQIIIDAPQVFSKLAKIELKDK